MGQTCRETRNVAESLWENLIERAKLEDEKRRWEYGINRDVRNTGCERSR
jgi:hypothetical protein